MKLDLSLAVLALLSPLCSVMGRLGVEEVTNNEDLQVSNTGGLKVQNHRRKMDLLTFSHF